MCRYSIYTTGYHDTRVSTYLHNIYAKTTDYNVYADKINGQHLPLWCISSCVLLRDW